MLRVQGTPGWSSGLDHRAGILPPDPKTLFHPSANMLLLGSRVSSRLRVKMWVMGKLVVAPLFLLAPLGTSCPPPVYTVVDCRETLYLAPSFSTGSALFSLLTTKGNQ